MFASRHGVSQFFAQRVSIFSMIYIAVACLQKIRVLKIMLCFLWSSKPNKIEKTLCWRTFFQACVFFCMCFTTDKQQPFCTTIIFLFMTACLNLFIIFMKNWMAVASLLLTYWRILCRAFNDLRLDTWRNCTRQKRLLNGNLFLLNRNIIAKMQVQKVFEMMQV